MMIQSLYQVLEIPSTATRTEIRAAYGRQIARIRSGELRSTRRPLIERACATLDNPDRRVSYDIQLTQRRPWGHPEPIDHSSYMHMLAPALAGAAAVVFVALGAFALQASPFRGQHQSALQARASVSQPVSPAGNQSDAPAVAPTDAASDDVPAVAATETANDTAAEAPADDAGVAPPAPAPIPFARSAPVLRAASPAPAAAARNRQADYVPAAPDEVSAADTDAASPPAANVAAEAAPAPALVQSASFGKVQANSSSRLKFRVQGWFCHDSTGGEVFVSAGAPLPSGVSCQ
jgi:hypothetical protein